MLNDLFRCFLLFFETIKLTYLVAYAFSTLRIHDLAQHGIDLCSCRYTIYMLLLSIDIWFGKNNVLYNCNVHSCISFFFFFFSVRLFSVLRGHSVFSSPPQRPTASDFVGFSIARLYPLHLVSDLNSWGRASISLFYVQC